MRVAIISGLGLLLLLFTSTSCNVYSNNDPDAGSSEQDGTSEKTDKGSFQGGDQKYTEEWSFDLDALCEYLDCGSSPASVVVGRLQVMPNPIFFQPNGLDRRDYSMSVENEGSEPVYIQDIHISGTRSFSLPYLDRPFPWSLGSNENHCGGGELFGCGITYSQANGEDQEGELAIVTEDPTSPTLAVPILADAEGRYTDDRQYDYIFPEANLGVQPNPVRIERLAPGESLIVEMCAAPMLREKRITHLEAYGDGFSIRSATGIHGNPIDLPINDYILNQEIQIELVYEQIKSEPNHGAVVIQHDDHRGITQTLIVPIVVQ